MAMPKKLTETRKVVALCDPSLAYFPAKKTKIVEGKEVPDVGLRYYIETLELEYLGDLSKLPGGGPTVFEIMPMQTKHMYLDKGEDSDWPFIFKLYCIGIEGGLYEKEEIHGMERKVFTDKAIDQIPIDYIKDIADKVIQLAKYDGVTVPFTMLDTSADALRRCRGASIRNISPVSTEGVKTSG